MSNGSAEIFDNQKLLEILKSSRENVNWEILDERRKFIHQVFPSVKQWFECQETILRYSGIPPSNIQDVFRSEEIECLAMDYINFVVKDKEKEKDKQYITNLAFFIKFMDYFGYKDEPKLDGDGKPSSRRTTPVHRAAKRDLYITRELFQIYNRYDVNYTDESGLSHFHVACKYSLKEEIKKFLELGHDSNCIDRETGNSPLHMYLIGNQTIESWEMNAEPLFRKVIDLNLANKDGLTPLHIISQKSPFDCLPKSISDAVDLIFEISEELNQPLQIDARDKFGNTPLHVAVFNHNVYAIEMLLRRGADPNSANDEGSTPLHLFYMRCDYYGSGTVKLFFEICDELNHLIQIDAKDKLGRTPLQLAVANLWPDCIDILFERGADLSNFVFPTESYFADRCRWRSHWFAVWGAAAAGWSAARRDTIAVEPAHSHADIRLSLARIYIRVYLCVLYSVIGKVYLPPRGDVAVSPSSISASRRFSDGAQIRARFSARMANTFFCKSACDIFPYVHEYCLKSCASTRTKIIIFVLIMFALTNFAPTSVAQRKLYLNEWLPQATFTLLQEFLRYICRIYELLDIAILPCHGSRDNRYNVISVRIEPRASRESWSTAVIASLLCVKKTKRETRPESMSYTTYTNNIASLWKTYVSFEWMFALSTRISRASIFFSTSSSHFNYTLVRSSLRSRDKAVNAYNNEKSKRAHRLCNRDTVRIYKYEFVNHSGTCNARGKGETIVYNASRESSVHPPLRQCQLVSSWKRVFDEKETVRICSTTDAVSRASNHSTSSSHHCDGRTHYWRSSACSSLKKLKTHGRSNREKREHGSSALLGLRGISLQGLSEAAAMQRVCSMCARHEPTASCSALACIRSW
ncbi:unnamed protein product [Trichogramma brassicae]|uniref:Uncharacterized protein n=1 Tax=Trichogramma brassicae TaxID=86971 RepID=A0A6H5J5W9_9HYME|nr:unnamed protein product [Trichogramma brassicae]